MTPVHRSIRYRIYPDRDQKRLITRTFGCARFVYNNMLQRSIAVYERGKSFCSRNAFNYALTDLKREHPFLYEVDSTALTSANSISEPDFPVSIERKIMAPTQRNTSLTHRTSPYSIRRSSFRS